VLGQSWLRKVRSVEPNTETVVTYLRELHGDGASRGVSSGTCHRNDMSDWNSENIERTRRGKNRIEGGGSNIPVEKMYVKKDGVSTTEFQQLVTDFG
jgi:hypothetical protein